jgi:hypothetical protein
MRLGALIAGLLGSYLAFALAPTTVAWVVAALLAAVFVGVTVAHRRVIAAIERHEALQRLLEAQSARLLVDWSGIPPHFPCDVAPEHPFDRDLLVTGERSLHHLLDTAASAGGSRRLARWLLAESPDLEKLETRQGLVRALIERPGLRTQLGLAGELIKAENTRPGQPAADRWDGDAILRWLSQHSEAGSLLPVLVILGLLAAANIVLFALNAAGLLPALWIATFLVYFGLQSARYRQSSEVFVEAYSLAKSLGQLRQLLKFLETYPYEPGSGLARLCAPFWKGPEKPSAELRVVNLVVSAAGLAANPVFGLVLNILVPWNLFFAYQLEKVKKRIRGLLPIWLDAWSELEALTALAGYAGLNPDAAFPRVERTVPGKPVLAARAMGHPLIPPENRVDNDFTLERLGQVVLITGSNMSGKSTFLRTVGANLCLAFAGGVVAAAEMQAVPFRLFASMNVSDSLNDGISFFYAEVRRLKALLDALHSGHAFPLFFMIDEIFRGTNNRERRIGSEAYVRALVGARGAGLISTHDLELVQLAEDFNEVVNAHFREDIAGERMVFDYLLRPGPSPTTNALRIMALAGLPVQNI